MVDKARYETGLAKRRATLVISLLRGETTVVEARSRVETVERLGAVADTRHDEMIVCTA